MVSGWLLLLRMKSRQVQYSKVASDCLRLLSEPSGFSFFVRTEMAQLKALQAFTHFSVTLLRLFSGMGFYSLFILV